MGLCPSKDMAIGLVIFNPAKSKKLIENYYEMIQQFEKYTLPFFTLELVYEDRCPEIPEAYHISGKSVMFHKENLCRILETMIPSKFTKLVFLDADIIFDDQEWYWKLSKALDSYDVVQPFETCFWLDEDKKIMLERESVLKMKSNLWDSKYHPGFAWGFRREWYNKIGFFDYAVTGSGDTLSVIKWLDKHVTPKFQSLPVPLLRKYNIFCPPEDRPLISFLPGSLRHLYHGSRENRQYTERHKILDLQEDIMDLVFVNSRGLLEWNLEHKNLSNKMLEYFISRNDDDLSVLIETS
jgi:hypothetical protein